MTRIEIIRPSNFKPVQLENLRLLWNAEYPKQVSYGTTEELSEYLGKLSSLKHIILTDSKGAYKGWLFLFERNDLPWFAMILSRDIQGLGWGRKMLEMAQQESEMLNGWVVDHDRYLRSDGTAYPSPSAFYKKLGFRIGRQRFETENLSLAHIIWP